MARENNWLPDDADEQDSAKCDSCGKRFSFPIDFDFAGDTTGTDILCRVCSDDYQ